AGGLEVDFDGADIKQSSVTSGVLTVPALNNQAFPLSRQFKIDELATARARLGQGNRVKKLCSDEACEEVVIPSGDFAAEAERIFARGSPDQVEGHVLDGGEVGRGVIGADTAFVIAEHHVHDPMEAVLD